MSYNWNATAKHRMVPAVVTIIEALFNWLAGQSWASGIWPGSGWRTGSNEHASGRAIDIIVVPRTGVRPNASQKAAGDRLAELLIRHGKALGIQWVLWSRDGVTTWSYNMDRGSWNRLARRGSISADHIDHLHVYFKASARLPRGFTFGAGTSAPAPDPAPGLPSTGVSKSVGEMATEVIAGKHGTGHDNRRRSLGITAAEYEVVRTEVNRRVNGGATPSRPTPAKTVGQMAVEVLAGKHGNGHENRRKSLGVSASVYESVRAEVNRRVSGGATSSNPAPSKSTRYRVVTASKPLNGRAGPGLQHRITMRAHKGAILDIVETRNGWAKSTGGHWYSMDFLRKV